MSARTAAAAGIAQAKVPLRESLVLPSGPTVKALAERNALSVRIG